LYYQINQQRDALDAYSRSIRLNPNLCEVWFDLGTLYESCSQTSDAIDAYQRASELDPNNKHIQSRLQILKSQLKNNIKPQIQKVNNIKEVPNHQLPSTININFNSTIQLQKKNPMNNFSDFKTLSQTKDESPIFKQGLTQNNFVQNTSKNIITPQRSQMFTLQNQVINKNPK
jgi:tetratricopeptide (TPR) repeat protein